MAEAPGPAGNAGHSGKCDATCESDCTRCSPRTGDCSCTHCCHLAGCACERCANATGETLAHTPCERCGEPTPYQTSLTRTPLCAGCWADLTRGDREQQDLNLKDRLRRAAQRLGFKFGA